MKLKHQLYEQCCNYISSKAKDIKEIIGDAIEASNNEPVNSTGDKFEGGREMMQQEIDLNIERLNELNKQKEILGRISPDQKNEVIYPGALVKTNYGYYYISIGAGQLKVDGVTYFAISASSPAGELLLGKKAGEKFTLNGKHFTIEKVY